MITKQQLLACDANIAPYVDAILATADKYKINTPLRMAHFVAQITHESGHFKFTKEGLSYSDVNRIVQIFKKYYDLDQNGVISQMEIDYAKGFVKQPIKLANRVYANRMGNGDEKSGDGYKFCGRGLIQLTGRNNYTAYSQYQYGDNRVIDNPELLTKAPDAVLSAAWYWSILRNINTLADRDDIVAVTKAVNGGTIGLEDRKANLAKAKKALGI